MRHPSEGILRRLVDEPAGVADPDRQHVRGCPVCLAGVAAARDDARAVAAALPTVSVSDADARAAWQRLDRAARNQPSPGPGTAAARRRFSLRRPVVAALGAVVVLSGAGVAAANDWFQMFRTEQVAAVQVSSTDLVRLPDLSGYGDLQITGQESLHRVADAAAARQETGIDVPQVATLPRGVTGEPEYQVVGRVSGTFTFSAQRAAQGGRQLPPMPAGLDGSSVKLEAGPGVAQVWSRSGGAPTLVVGRAGAPTASSSGVSFETMRGYLLSLPDLPADVAAQLRAFRPEAATLPVPVPSDLASSSPVEVHGRPGTLVTSRDGLFAGVVWAQDGTVTLVAGSLSADEVLAVARDLR